MFKIFVFCVFAFTLSGVSAASVTKKPITKQETPVVQYPIIADIQESIGSALEALRPNVSRGYRVLLGSARQFADAVEDAAKSLKLNVQSVQGMVAEGISGLAEILLAETGELQNLTKNAKQKLEAVEKNIDNVVSSIFEEVKIAANANLLSAQKYGATFLKDFVQAGKQLQTALEGVQNRQR